MPDTKTYSQGGPYVVHAPFGTHNVHNAEAYPGNNATLEIVDLCKLSLVDQLLGVLATPDPNSAACT